MRKSFILCLAVTLTMLLVACKKEEHVGEVETDVAVESTVIKEENIGSTESIVSDGVVDDVVSDLYEITLQGNDHVYVGEGYTYTMTTATETADLQSLVNTLVSANLTYNINLSEIVLSELQPDIDDIDFMLSNVVRNAYPGYNGETFWTGNYSDGVGSYSIFLFAEDVGYYYAIEKGM